MHWHLVVSNSTRLDKILSFLQCVDCFFSSFHSSFFFSFWTLKYFCIAPGSRSSPLTINATRHPLTNCISCYDERSLAFHALGYARGSQKPAVVITSSGTAVSNLLPAVILFFILLFYFYPFIENDLVFWAFSINILRLGNANFLRYYLYSCYKRKKISTISFLFSYLLHHLW